MSSNYPPGVTGNEYAIAGPDYEEESDLPCPKCGKPTLEQRYRHDRWLVCENDHTTGLEPLDEGPDPDRAHDEAVERRLFGDDRYDDWEE